jgi:hypothetical protein
MGLRFYPTSTLPRQYDVVWCLYPESGLTPGPTVRPALVLDVRIEQQQQIGAVVVTYGTGVFDQSHQNRDLVVTGDEYGKLGLHKPTRFALSLNSRMCLPWCEEYFVPPPYAKSQGLRAGSLTDRQIARLLACFEVRGLKPYKA